MSSSSSDESGSSPRLKYHAHQQKKLEEIFEKQRFINGKQVEDLAFELGVSNKQIKTWFQNKRAKLKRQEYKRSGRPYPLLSPNRLFVPQQVSPTNRNTRDFCWTDIDSSPGTSPPNAFSVSSSETSPSTLRLHHMELANNLFTDSSNTHFFNQTNQVSYERSTLYSSHPAPTNHNLLLVDCASASHPASTNQNHLLVDCASASHSASTNQNNLLVDCASASHPASINQNHLLVDCASASHSASTNQNPLRVDLANHLFSRASSAVSTHGKNICHQQTPGGISPRFPMSDVTNTFESYARNLSGWTPEVDCQSVYLKVPFVTTSTPSDITSQRETLFTNSDERNDDFYSSVSTSHSSIDELDFVLDAITSSSSTSRNFPLTVTEPSDSVNQELSCILDSITASTSTVDDSHDDLDAILNEITTLESTSTMSENADAENITATGLSVLTTEDDFKYADSNVDEIVNILLQLK